MKDRIENFKKNCYDLGITDEAFISYWVECSINGKKFRAEKEKVFDIKRRWATWERNNLKWYGSKPSQTLEAYQQAKKMLGI